MIILKRFKTNEHRETLLKQHYPSSIYPHRYAISVSIADTVTDDCVDLTAGYSLKELD